MRKALITGALALATLFTVQAQDNKTQLANIRSWYAQALSDATEMSQHCNGPCSMTTATVKRMEAAVGSVTYQIQYYTALSESNTFYRCKRKAINSTIDIEILYHEGKVIFIFEKDYENGKETRVYYNEKGIPFKTLQNGKDTTLKDYEYQYFKRFADLEYKKYENAVSTGYYPDPSEE